MSGRVAIELQSVVPAETDSGKDGQGMPINIHTRCSAGEWTRDVTAWAGGEVGYGLSGRILEVVREAAAVRLAVELQRDDRPAGGVEAGVFAIVLDLPKTPDAKERTGQYKGRFGGRVCEGAVRWVLRPAAVVGGGGSPSPRPAAPHKVAP
jgi:hypothetical protein